LIVREGVCLDYYGDALAIRLGQREATTRGIDCASSGHRSVTGERSNDLHLKVALLWFRMEKYSSRKANTGSPQSFATFNYCEIFFRRRAITPARQTPTPIIR
jgi:hypothetical protein